MGANVHRVGGQPPGVFAHDEDVVIEPVLCEPVSQLADNLTNMLLDLLHLSRACIRGVTEDDIPHLVPGAGMTQAFQEQPKEPGHLRVLGAQIKPLAEPVHDPLVMEVWLRLAANGFLAR